MSLRALVVDDECAIADSLRVIIEAAGFIAVAAYSGEDAISAAKQMAPDILLTDVLMPDLNGFELALQVKAIAPQCRLMLFSGQAATVQLAERYAETFAAKRHTFVLLPKPLHPSVLIQEMRDAFTRVF
jgi:CheY-like chemotaxis protein